MLFTGPRRIALVGADVEAGWGDDMTTRKRKSPAKLAKVRRLPASPAVGMAKVAKALREQQAPFLKRLAAEGTAPEVGTIVYVHGIGNKPEASVLKCQWDTALFGAPMGDRTRMSYWVNRERYTAPEAGTCASRDDLAGEGGGLGIRALGDSEDAGPALTREQQKAFDEPRGAPAGERSGRARTGPRTKVLPLPEGMRRWTTKLLTRLFLKDVRDFLYAKGERARMELSVRERLDGRRRALHRDRPQPGLDGRLRGAAQAGEERRAMSASS